MPARDVNVESQSSTGPSVFYPGVTPAVSSHISLTMASHMAMFTVRAERRSVILPCIWKEEENHNMVECLNDTTTHSTASHP